MTISGVDPQRIIARVKHVDTDHSVAYLEIPNGNVIPHHMYEDAEFKPGDMVLIGPQWDDVETAPRELWREEPWVGVIRLLLLDEVVVDIGGKMRTFPRPNDLDLQEGSTAEGIDSSERPSERQGLRASGQTFRPGRKGARPSVRKPTYGSDSTLETVGVLYCCRTPTAGSVSVMICRSRAVSVPKGASRAQRAVCV